MIASFGIFCFLDGKCLGLTTTKKLNKFNYSNEQKYKTKKCSPNGNLSFKQKNIYSIYKNVTIFAINY